MPSATSKRRRWPPESVRISAEDFSVSPTELITSSTFRGFE